MTSRTEPAGTPVAPAASPTSTELLVTRIAFNAMAPPRGVDDDPDALGPLDDPDVQLRVVRLLGRSVLTADTAAVRAAERAIAGRSNRERVRIIASLGALSAAAEQTTSSTLDPLVQSAARECGVARSLVTESRARLRSRQTNHEFMRWVTRDPSGFSRWVWSTALRAAGGRVWDRSWATIAETLRPDAWSRICPHPPDDARSGWRPFDESAAIARRAAVETLVTTALSEDPVRWATAWRDALSGAQRTAGTQTWARFANQIRSEIGPATWVTINASVAERGATVVADISRVAGFTAMIALATEASTAPVRAAVVAVGARALTRFADIDTALEAAANETHGGILLDARK